MVIGMTGGVGSGKSTVLQYMNEKYGAYIILADDVARDLMMPSGASYNSVVSFFGEDICIAGPGSEIDRGRLAKIVFDDPVLLEKLNSITHPQVKEEILRIIDRLGPEEKKLVIIEAALLIQADYTDIIDQLWVVTTDLETRISRLYETRGYSREKTLSIMRNQLSDEEMKAYADVIIDNSGSLDDMERQIDINMDNIYAGNQG